MMEYNPEFIHFEHADGLIGKWCIASDTIFDIKATLSDDDDYIKGQLVQIKMVDDDKGFPFITTANANHNAFCPYRFVYVDPAFNEKPIVLRKDLARWLALGYGQMLNLKNDRVYTHFYYDSKDENVPVDREKFKVREWNETEWKDVEAILNKEF